MGSFRFQAYSAQIQRINMAELIDQHILSQRRPHLSLIAPRTASHDGVHLAPSMSQTETMPHG
jgi:hypothetical protein